DTGQHEPGHGERLAQHWHLGNATGEVDTGSIQEPTAPGRPVRKTRSRKRLTAACGFAVRTDLLRADAGVGRVAAPATPAGQRLVAGVDHDELAVLRADVDLP